jgi:hypothetical protein
MTIMRINLKHILALTTHKDTYLSKCDKNVQFTNTLPL